MGGRRKDPRSKIIDKSFEVPAKPARGFLSKDYFLSCFAFENETRIFAFSANEPLSERTIFQLIEIFPDEHIWP